MSDLKPCPFCGSEAKLMYYYPIGGRRQTVVNCTSCRCNSGRWGRSDKAIEAWNRRAKDDNERD